jgi:pyruvate formate lyase activating enzyme
LPAALALVGERRTAEEIMEVVLRDRVFYEASGGGVTLSGGEPLAQAHDAKELLYRAHAEHLHTAVETCGYAGPGVVESFLGLVDLWLFDIKHADPDAHRALTGVSNAPILANLDLLLASKAEVILRVPLIPGVNDDGPAITGLTKLLRRRPRLKETHIMPYHPLAESKYESLGLPYSLRGLRRQAEQMLALAVRPLSELGVRVVVGG